MAAAAAAPPAATSTLLSGCRRTELRMRCAARGGVANPTAIGPAAPSAAGASTMPAERPARGSGAHASLKPPPGAPGLWVGLMSGSGPCTTASAQAGSSAAMGGRRSPQSMPEPRCGPAASRGCAGPGSVAWGSPSSANRLRRTGLRAAPAPPAGSTPAGSAAAPWVPWYVDGGVGVACSPVSEARAMAGGAGARAASALEERSALARRPCRASRRPRRTPSSESLSSSAPSQPSPPSPSCACASGGAVSAAPEPVPVDPLQLLPSLPLLLSASDERARRAACSGGCGCRGAGPCGSAPGHVAAAPGPSAALPRAGGAGALAVVGAGAAGGSATGLRAAYDHDSRKPRSGEAGGAPAASCSAMAPQSPAWAGPHGGPQPCPAQDCHKCERQRSSAQPARRLRRLG